MMSLRGGRATKMPLTSSSAARSKVSLPSRVKRQAQLRKTKAESSKAQTPVRPVALSSVEVHPIGPYVTQYTQVILCGSFMPLRRQMPFYYPNPSNDMWSILGSIFFGDKTHFYLPRVSLGQQPKRFDVEAIMRFVEQGPVGFCDVAHSIQRRQGSAADDNLIIVAETDIRHAVLTRAPQCQAIIATGTLSMTHLCAQLTATLPHTTFSPKDQQLLLSPLLEKATNKAKRAGHAATLPPMGECVTFCYRRPCVMTEPQLRDDGDTRVLRVYRAPSTSRAYPMRVEQKTHMYRSILEKYCDTPSSTRRASAQGS